MPLRSAMAPACRRTQPIVVPTPIPLLSFFFFQAEDGIRYYKVTGVQTCALPIFALPTENFVVGLHEAPGTQSVYLKSYLGLELTLLMVTALALEDLGGRPREPITDRKSVV